MVVNILQIITVFATILTGLYSLVAPTKIESFTGIRAVGGRGITEIRAIFGGVFIGLGITALVLDTAVAYPLLGIIYLVIAAVRLPAMFMDRSVEQSNIISLLVEVVFGVILLI